VNKIEMEHRITLPDNFAGLRLSSEQRRGEGGDRQVPQLMMWKKKENKSRLESRKRGGIRRGACLLQHPLHFLKAKNDAFDENDHAPREKASPATRVDRFSLCLVFGFRRSDIKSFTMLAPPPCSAACTRTALLLEFPFQR
jgi:hypothetical protein